MRRVKHVSDISLSETILEKNYEGLKSLFAGTRHLGTSELRSVAELFTKDYDPEVHEIVARLATSNHRENRTQHLRRLFVSLLKRAGSSVDEDFDALVSEWLPRMREARSEISRLRLIRLNKTNRIRVKSQIDLAQQTLDGAPESIKNLLGDSTIEARIEASGFADWTLARLRASYWPRSLWTQDYYREHIVPRLRDHWGFTPNNIPYNYPSRDPGTEPFGWTWCELPLKKFKELEALFLIRELVDLMPRERGSGR